MRVPSFLLGLLGGLAGLGVHAVLLVRFFSQSHGLFHVFLELALATALGVAGALIAVLCRRSQKTLVVSLSVIGVLGFFPRPVSWIPAGVLLVAGSALALIGLRRSSGEHSTDDSDSAVTPDGTALHWSEAARLELAPIPPATGATRFEEDWSPAKKAGAAAAALVAAAIILPLSLCSPWSPSAGPATTSPVAQVTTTASLPISSTTTLDTVGPTTTAVTVEPRTTTTVAPHSELFDNYSDGLRGISIDYPKKWRNTDPSNVGDRTFWDSDRVFRDEWQDAYVAAAFADWQGPTLDGCYLDYIWVEVHDDVAVDPSMISDFQTWLEDWVIEIGQYYSDVRVLEPVRDVVVSGLPGLVHTWTIFVNGHTLVTRECVLLADNCYYFLEFTAVKDDWDACEPLFRDILENFRATGSSQLI